MEDKLSSTLEDYLEAIFRLEKTKRTARVRDIAQTVGVSKSTVSAALKSLAGKNLVDSNLRKDFGVIIVAIKKMEGNMIFNPLPSETLESGDVIVVIGKKEDLKRMNAVM